MVLIGKKIKNGKMTMFAEKINIVDKYVEQIQNTGTPNTPSISEESSIIVREKDVPIEKKKVHKRHVHYDTPQLLFDEFPSSKSMKDFEMI